MPQTFRGVAVGIAVLAGSAAVAQPCAEGWRSAPGGLGGGVATLAVLDLGAGPELYAGGAFEAPGPNLARWTGSTWVGVGGGVNGPVYALAAFDDGYGLALYAGGAFTSAGGAQVSNIARWNGQTWSSMDGGMYPWPGLQSAAVRAFAVYDDGSGPALYVGGEFGGALAIPSPWRAALCKWRGFWALENTGLNHTTTYPFVTALRVFDDGSGPALYVGGNFDRSATPIVSMRNIGRWKGAWSALAGGVDSSVYALEVFDPGTGPALFAGGAFATAFNASPPNVAAPRIARWRNNAWSSIGGVSGGSNPLALVLKTRDDGEGPALYVGGQFTQAPGAAALNIVRWDGALWSRLGSGANAFVNALAVLPSGYPRGIVAGGGFTAVGGAVAAHVATWDGQRHPCSGDADCDRSVGFTDLNHVLSDFFVSGPALRGDLNGNGSVDAQDLSLCLAQYGQGCSALDTPRAGPDVHSGHVSADRRTSP